MSVLVRSSTRLWLAGAMVIVLLLAGFLTVTSLANTASAAPEANQSQGCLGCHPQALKFHDKLGTGNEACRACHDSSNMSLLRLSNGTRLPLSESPQLCAQCHQARYNAWEEGTHGIAGPSTEKCADCHNPHQPEIALNITKPHPEPAPPPPPPPSQPLIILGITLLFMMGIGVVMMGGE